MCSWCLKALTPKNIFHVGRIFAACKIVRSSLPCSRVHFTSLCPTRKKVDAMTRTLFSGTIHVTLPQTVGLKFFVLVVQKAKSSLLVSFFAILVIFTSDRQRSYSQSEKKNAESVFHAQESWKKCGLEQILREDLQGLRRSVSSRCLLTV